jgi:hypothetical protein
MVPGEPETSYEFVIAMNARNAGRCYPRPHLGRSALSKSDKLWSTGADRRGYGLRLDLPQGEAPSPSGAA